jgi:hypothetical protein
MMPEPHFKRNTRTKLIFFRVGAQEGTGPDGMWGLMQGGLLALTWTAGLHDQNKRGET